MTGELVEEFDDTAHMAPETTASWGGGVLAADLSDFGGDGSDGPFHATADLQIDTTANGGVFQHTTYEVDAGVTVTVSGPNPYVVRVQSDAVIHGWLRSDGTPGQHACGTLSGKPAAPGGVALAGGDGGAGGGKGGDGGAGFGQTGGTGEGPGGGTGSAPGESIFDAGAGGASFGSAGDNGVDGWGNVGAGLAGPTYGTAELFALLGGSGGGGGGGSDQGNGALDSGDRPGGSGGGGGGAIGIFALGDIQLSGGIIFDGGIGGWGDFSGGGGGGSGGAVKLVAMGEVLFEGGTVSARGGRGGLITNSNQLEDIKGGDGGDGVVRIESALGLQGYVANPDPPPSYAAPPVPPMAGDGSDGPFEPDADTVLDTDQGPYFFSSFVIPEGVTLTAQGSLPLEVYSTNGMSIDGTIQLSAGHGGPGYSACCSNPYANAEAGDGGAAGPGGYPGGAGGSAGAGESGQGPGGAPGGPPGVFSSAGGAGYANAGQPGGTNVCQAASGPVGGQPYGGEDLAILEGGSGGGGAGDAVAAACTWCYHQECIVTNDFSYTQCPANPPDCSYCPNVPSACEGIADCFATSKWNPGSGGGGGGGALRLETPGELLMTGSILLDGGDGGASVGSNENNDGSCGPGCTGGCYKGACNPPGGGSFGGSGGGGSGGALLIRAGGVRSLGLLSAVGGRTGMLSQGGGCPVDPDADNPIPGQGRGGRGSPGRIRIETVEPLGSILIGDGLFTTSMVTTAAGTSALSTWYQLPAPVAQVTAVLAEGLGPADVLELQTAPDGNGGGTPDEAAASVWLPAAGDLPPGRFVRFRVQLLPPVPPDPGSIVESVTIVWQYELEPLP